MSILKITFNFVLFISLFYENAMYSMQRFSNPMQRSLMTSLMARRNAVTMTGIEKNKKLILYLPQEFQALTKENKLSQDKDVQHLIVNNDSAQWRVINDFCNFLCLVAPVYDASDKQGELIKYYAIVATAIMQDVGLHASSKLFDEIVGSSTYKTVKRINDLADENNEYPLFSNVVIMPDKLATAESLSEESIKRYNVQIPHLQMRMDPLSYYKDWVLFNINKG